MIFVFLVCYKNALTYLITYLLIQGRVEEPVRPCRWILFLPHPVSVRDVGRGCRNEVPYDAAAAERRGRAAYHPGVVDGARRSCRLTLGGALFGDDRRTVRRADRDRRERATSSCARTVVSTSRRGRVGPASGPADRALVSLLRRRHVQSHSPHWRRFALLAYLFNRVKIVREVHDTINTIQ